MLGLIRGTQKYFAWKKISKAKKEHLVFNLHKLTGAVLLTLSAVITGNIYLGNPIYCVGDKTIDRVVDVYCWIHSTYTLPDSINYKNGSKAIVAHPGVGPDHDQLPVYHKYYQWVCFVFFFQGVSFRLGAWMWKGLEGGAVSKLAGEIKAGKTKKVAEYFYHRKFLKIVNISENTLYSLYFIFCEVYNFLNVLLQVYLTNLFVGKALTRYGLANAWRYMQENPLYRTDSMAKAFPKVTKCTFRMFGPTGNIVKYDNLCVLPLNIYNEKIYPFIWVWFIILSVLSFLQLLYRLLSIVMPTLRATLLGMKLTTKNGKHPNQSEIFKLPFSDWFFLYNILNELRSNSRADFCRELVSLLASENVKQPLLNAPPDENEDANKDKIE